jgi:hypothetical protein
MSLDPTDWAAVRAVGKRMVDDMLDYQETVRERPPWRPVPDEVRTRLDEPVPLEGAPALGEEILDRGSGCVAVSGAQGDRHWASPAGKASRSHSEASLETEGES